jgi:hypothetical protein
MFALALICTGFLGIIPDDPTPSSTPTLTPAPALETYQALAKQVGRDSPAQVKLALWCEAQGLDAERLKHLALAVLTDPKNVTARGLLGLVRYRDRWERPEQVDERIKEDEALTAKLAEYNSRREKLAARLLANNGGRAPARAAAATAHLTLGLWCQKNGLDAEAKAHFTSATVLDPYNDTPWKALGYVKHNGRWMSREQVAAEQRESQSQRKADRSWEPLLKKWRGWLANTARREEALALLNDVVDPHATGPIVRVFRDGDPEHEQLAVQMLARIETPAATVELAVLAVLGKTQLVRSAAIEALRSRPVRDYVGMLVDQIHAPMKYQVEPVRGPGSPGALAIETPRFRMLRTYDAPTVFQPGANFHGYVGYDGNGMPIIVSGKELRRMSTEVYSSVGRLDLAALEQRTQTLIAAANLKATASLQMMIDDVNAIEYANARTTVVNARIASSLQGAADAPKLDPGNEDEWHRWWYDQLGYRYDPPPQVLAAVNASPQSAGPSIRSCFVAGTPVRTIHGLRPIETLQVGDQVLSQDTASGGLSFQPILVVHHNPPGSTLRLELDNGETLVPSIYHRFWRAGKGWAIARDLKPGEILRTLEGRTRIKAITPGRTEPIYNLDVDGPRTFFVGDHGALVHDNTLPASPTAPFDAEPAL